MKNIDELSITKDLIRDLMFYGIVKGWEIERLREEYKRLDIPSELVNKTLIECAEGQ